MREKLKPFRVLIVGILIITAFLKGAALNIALIIFTALFIIYSVIKRCIAKNRTPKGKTYKIILTPKADKFLRLACAMMLKSKGGMLDAISKIIR